MLQKLKSKQRCQRLTNVAGIRSVLHHRIKRTADRLTAAASKMKTSKLLWMLAIFCLFFSGLSCWIMLKSKRGSYRTILQVTSISILPLHSEPLLHGGSSKNDLQRIQEFRAYLEKLNTTAAGRRRRDSFLQHRPFLLDSLNAFEKIYFTQIKK